MIEPTIKDDAPHPVGPSPSRSRFRSLIRGLAALTVVSLLLTGPWPVDDSRYEAADYSRRTVARLDATPVSRTAGPFKIGLAEVDLTPTTPLPLAGFIGQIRTPYVGVDSPCFARALTVDSVSGTVTVLTADLLLINARLARSVLEKTGLRPDQVDFTASHTHGGPGGWGDHPLEMLVAGAYDPDYFDLLTTRLAEVVQRSREHLVPAEVGFVSVQALARQSNRVEPGTPTHDALSALVFRSPEASETSPPLAILVVFGAHATVSHPVPPRLGADYPAAIVQELKRRTGAGTVLFASGAVGDASPSRPRAPSQRESAEALGVALAGDLMTALPSTRFEREVVVAHLRLDVDLPPLRLPFFTPWLRFSPAASWWISDRTTHLHALRIGPAVLVGFPGDYSGHLATRLAEATRQTGLTTVATSFAGDFRGYLVSEAVHRRRACYETRWMSFYGPSAGDYLTDLAVKMVERLAVDRPPTVSASKIVDPGPRLALAVLLVAGGFLVRPHVRELGERMRRLGFVSKIMVVVASLASLGFVVAPGRVDWDVVGLPFWVRLLGFPIGVVALTRIKRQGLEGWLIPFALACFLLTAGWVVALAILRVTWIDGLLNPSSLRRRVAREEHDRIVDTG